MKHARICTLILAGLVLVGALVAQRPDAWAELSVTGGVNPNALVQRGKVLVYQESDKVHCYSSFVGEWRSLPVSGPTVITHANDWAMIQEGVTFTGFSSMRGSFASVTLSSSAFLVNPPSQRNDSIVVMRDGNEIWTYSAFTGLWDRVAVASSATVVVQRHTAAIANGTLIYGKSAFRPGWVLQQTGFSITELQADGTVATARSAGRLYGFSAIHSSWVNTTAPSGIVISLIDDDVALWSDSLRIIGFSGPRGTFATRTTNTPTNLLIEQQMGAAQSDKTVHFYSAVTGNWTSLTTQFHPLVTLSAATALVEEPDEVHGYSAMRDVIDSIAITPSTSDVNWTVAAAAAVGSNGFFLFSSFVGRWLQINEATAFPQLVFNGALIRTSNGFSAYSSRTEERVPLSVSAAAFPHLIPQSGILAIEDAPNQKLHAFDARRSAWVSTDTQGGVLQVGVWRTAMYAIEGQRVFGFGSQTGVFDIRDLPEGINNALPSSEVVSVVTPNFVYGFSPVSSVGTYFQFPEFRRLYGRGAPLHVAIQAEPSSAAAIVLGLPARDPVPNPVGDVFLNPLTLGLLWIGTVDGDGYGFIDTEIPDTPALSGLVLGFQGAVVRPGGEEYFTRLNVLQIP